MGETSELRRDELMDVPPHVLPSPGAMWRPGPPRGYTPPRPLALGRLSSPHVLVMDAHLELLDVLGHLFHDERYSVTLSSHLLDVETIADVAPEVIVLDPIVNGTDAGRQLVRALRVDERVRHIPVVCCTTLPAMAAALREDGLPALLKPYDLEELLAAVAAHCPGKGG